jgi:hypothetical protein
MRCLVVLLATLVPVSAQWLHYTTPGIPRTPDGKADLSAAAPKTPDGKPDLSGIWRGPEDKWFRDLTTAGAQISMLPWADALYKQRVENLEKGHPSERCLGHGVTDYDTSGTIRRFIQTPKMFVMLFEGYNHYRQIFLDGRPLPTPTQPSYLGYSVGHWDGDTLVVETNGLQVTVDDPTAYAKPWTANLRLDYRPDVELIEDICENEKDFQHLVGK